MADTRNLFHAEAVRRARLIEVRSYDITLDLTDGAGGPGQGTFRSRTEIRFRCTDPGAGTFAEAAAETIHSAALNAVPVDTAGWAPGRGLSVAGLAAANTLVVDAEFAYSNSGQGLHRFLDPADGEVYLYSQFEVADAQRVFACFDQPDLTAAGRSALRRPAPRARPGTTRSTRPGRARRGRPRSPSGGRRCAWAAGGQRQRCLARRRRRTTRWRTGRAGGDPFPGPGLPPAPPRKGPR